VLFSQRSPGGVVATWRSAMTTTWQELPTKLCSSETYAFGGNIPGGMPSSAVFVVEHMTGASLRRRTTKAHDAPYRYLLMTAGR